MLQKSITILLLITQMASLLPWHFSETHACAFSICIILSNCTHCSLSVLLDEKAIKCL